MTTIDSTQKSTKVIKTFLLLVSLNFVLSAYSQHKTDTLYYTKQWELSTNADDRYYTSVTNCMDSTHCNRTYYNNNGEIYSSLTLLNNVKHGQCNWYFDDGQLKLSAIYKDDQLDGLVKRFNENGTVEIYELYEQGKLIASYVYNADNQKVYFLSEKPALLVGEKNVKSSAKRLKKIIKSNTQEIFDEELNPIHGEVLVEFIINKDGVIEFPQFIGADSVFIEQEAERILMSIPKFQPAVHESEPVLSFGSITISI